MCSNYEYQNEASQDKRVNYNVPEYETDTKLKKHH